MGFPRFNFSKLWTSATDFPTVETDEARVRADMQRLHDEAKNGLNGLMDSLEDQGAAGNLGAVDPDNQSKSTVQTLLNQLSKNLKDALTMSGNLPLGGTTGQVLRKSSDNNYETEWGAVPEDQLPAHLTRNNQLKAQTAALFGLDETAVPDDVLTFLGKYNQHWWMTATDAYAIQKNTGRTVYFTSNRRNNTVTYAESITFDADAGVITMVDPQTVEIVDGTDDELSAQGEILLGKYVTHVFLSNTGPATDEVYFIPEGASVIGDATYGKSYVNIAVWQRVVMDWQNATIQYITGNSRDAYPDTGTVDGVTYQYLGVPFAKLSSAAAELAPANIIGILDGYNGTEGVTVNLGKQPKMVIVGNKVGFSNIITGSSTSSHSAHTVAMPGYPGYHSYLTGDLVTSGVALEVTKDGFTLNAGFKSNLAPYFYLALM